jgi:hypothetical protein
MVTSLEKAGTSVLVNPTQKFSRYVQPAKRRVVPPLM